MDHTEDFSFPRINDTFSHNIDSPPLWNLSPATSPNPYQLGNKGEQQKNDSFGGAKVMIAQDKAQRKSFSCVEKGMRRIQLDDDDDDEEEEKMDLLWEDFNEELCSSTTTTTGSATSSSSREGVEFKTNNINGALIPTTNNNKPPPGGGMVVIVRVMKKLFSVKNSQGKSRRKSRMIL